MELELLMYLLKLKKNLGQTFNTLRNVKYFNKKKVLLFERMARLSVRVVTHK